LANTIIFKGLYNYFIPIIFAVVDVRTADLIALWIESLSEILRVGPGLNEFLIISTIQS